MADEVPVLDVRKKLRMALLGSFILPVLILIFFSLVPYWLNSRLRAQLALSVNKALNLTAEERNRRLENVADLDFRKVSLDTPAGMEGFHEVLVKEGVVSTFQRLQWGLRLSLLIVMGLALSAVAVFALNNKARRSPSELIRGYRLSWKICVAAVLAEVFLLIPLLTYATFEFTVLLMDKYVPKLLLAIVIMGLIALWKTGSALLKRVPLEFTQPMAREVSRSDAPELWQAVERAAERLNTAPPDRIIVGLDLNFYVTEFAVIHDSGRAEGKTLYFSCPLLKQLSEDEVLAIIGHELGHFIGEDTKMTRDFYPLRYKVHGTMMAMAAGGVVGWPGLQFLNFFSWCFGETEQTSSRSRELLADQKAAELTSPQTAAQALIRFQVACEAFQHGFQNAVKTRTGDPMNLPLQSIVEETFAPEAGFWTRLFEKKLPHPLDSHPTLQTRLDSLGQSTAPEEARRLALVSSESAYQKWFSTREALFSNLNEQAQKAVEGLRSQHQVVEADPTTEAGRQLLDQHFPETKWEGRPVAFWVMVSLLGLIGSGLIAGAVLIDLLPFRILFLILFLLLALAVTVVFKRHYKAQLILTAQGLSYSGWKRPLLFADVQNITAVNSNSAISLTFHLKTEQDSYLKINLYPFPIKRLQFGLSVLAGKPIPIAQTIFRYHARQLEN